MMNKALNCTHEMAINHLHELAEELIPTGIFTDSYLHAPGKWAKKSAYQGIFILTL